MTKEKDSKDLIQLDKPVAVFEDDRIIFNWPDYQIQSIVDRLTDEGECEQSVYYGNNGHRQLIHISEVKLKSGTSRKNFSAALSERNGDFDWTTFETHIVNETMQYIRREMPVVNLNTPFERQTVNYLIYPVLPANTAISIHQAGGKLKSYLALYLGCLVQYAVSDNKMGWTVNQGNVLYLDWEEPDKEAYTQKKRFHAILKGLGITDDRQFLHLTCNRTFVDMLPQIKQLVRDRKIALIIIDSQMAATASNANYAQDVVSSQFFNAVNSLHVTALIVDHITKADMHGDEVALAAYGSIVKFNRARVQYALETEEITPTEFNLSLIRTKNNNVPKIKPIGIKVEFDDDENGIERQTTFSKLDLEKSAELYRTMLPTDKMKSALKHGFKTIKQISEITGMKESTINTNLRRYSEIFIKSEQKSGKEDLWGLVDNDHQESLIL